ncbi:S8 family serine peptidase [Pseudoalteromonas sp. JC3]|uniref:S8 family peptidase n=1 Tax=Pseudoalteromonas sp. JC3 TaxID=2810196 RepID=UPI0019D2B20D|nr:S8 family serine peptidase [Pseudoalteromonas sp. JC3]MBR8842350.1 S8 family serine peptidase [Pseudoalteromonas sp. JC3]WJE09526.1 S8 family serine peptidase [Pseudoalteromonas sp. JC3]
MIKKCITLLSISTAFASMQLSANDDNEAKNRASHPLYYEVLETKYLSEKNEFNTLLDELNSIQITPYWINQTGLDAIPQPTGEKLKVCIIDSGVDANHNDLSQMSINGYWNTYGGNWGEDNIGHGTHISGIISALDNNSGVRGAIDNGHVDIHVQKLVQSARGAGSTINDKNLIDSIEICASAGAKIINLSLSGMNYSGELRDVIDRLTYQNGIIFVAAAGNHGNATGYDSPAYPAAYRNVIGVGAININGELADFSPSYSGVSIVAPGVDILSTIPSNYNKVASVYYESREGYVEFDHYQIDKGLDYPETLPTQDSCYHNLSATALSEQITNKELSNSSINELNQASAQCSADGGSVLVISYDYLATLEKEEFRKFNPWLSTLDYDASMPTLLMPGLNNDEINFFKNGDIRVTSQQQGYAAVTGTSQSAAIVTAGIAKLWSNYPAATAEKILNAVIGSALPLDYNYPANAVGSGAVHFGNAYAYMQNYNNVHKAPSCPAAWYDNKGYESSEKATFKGDIYQANYWTKGQMPDSNSAEYGPWKKVASCATPPKEAFEYEQEISVPNYTLNEIERIQVVYKCNSYSFSCGGGGLGGGSGWIDFGGGYGGGGNYGGGEGGGGGGGSSNSDKNSEKEKQKQKEYEDIKKRSETTPKQKPGESKEDYNKRLSEYFKKVAQDYKKWDDRYNKGRHTQKIQELTNRAQKYQKAYENAVRHRQVTEQYKNGKKPKSSMCRAKTRGVAKVVQTIGCMFDEP